MLEKKVLRSSLDSRDVFEKVLTVLHGKFAPHTLFTEYGTRIFKLVEEYYEADPEATEVDMELLRAKIEGTYPKLADTFNEYLNELPESASAPNVLELLINQKREVLANKMAALLIDNPLSEEADELMEERMALRELEEDDDVLVHCPDIHSLVAGITGENLIPVYPAALNTKLGGGVPVQSQILIYARPDVGKTVTAMNIAGAAAMDGYKVLYFGNEDPTKLMVMRFISRITGIPKWDIIANPSEAIAVAEQNGLENFYFKELHPGTLPEIRKYIKMVRPDIVIVDQIKLIRASKEGPTRNLEEGCIGMRSMAKEYGFVSVLVTQAGESGANKLILDMEDVEWSNTGVQGQMDLMIGVGQNSTFKEQNQVMLSFSKNKFTEPIKPFACKINYPLNKLQGPRL